MYVYILGKSRGQHTRHSNVRMTGEWGLPTPWQAKGIQQQLDVVFLPCIHPILTGIIVHMLLCMGKHHE